MVTQDDTVEEYAGVSAVVDYGVGDIKRPNLEEFNQTYRFKVTHRAAAILVLSNIHYFLADAHCCVYATQTLLLRVQRIQVFSGHASSYKRSFCSYGGVSWLLRPLRILCMPPCMHSECVLVSKQVAKVLSKCLAVLCMFERFKIRSHLWKRMQRQHQHVHTWINSFVNQAFVCKTNSHLPPPFPKNA